MPVGRFKGIVQTIGKCLIRRKRTEVAALLIGTEHIGHKPAELRHILCRNSAVSLHLDAIIAEVRNHKVTQQLAAVSVRIGADPAIPLRCQLLQICAQRTVFIEQLLRMIAPEPGLDHAYMFRL